MPCRRAGEERHGGGGWRISVKVSAVGGAFPVASSAGLFTLSGPSDRTSSRGRGCELTVTAITPVEAVLLIWADIAALRRDFGDVRGQLAEPPERSEQPRPPRMIQ